MNCIICKNVLKGKQKKFCSKKCKFKDNNIKNQNYIKQQERAKKRKIKIINERGGCCKICGYNKNYSALVFHHIESNKKDFNIDSRKFSNTSWEKLLIELEKCELVCHNCHNEIHNPQCLL